MLARITEINLSTNPRTNYRARRLARSSRTSGTSSTGMSIAVCVVDSYAASSSATASTSD
jgi:hypothetical protein